MKIEDMIGKKFGRLTILAEAASRKYVSPKGKEKNIKYCVCLCDCGIQFEVIKRNIVCGNTKSCGCFRRDFMIKKETTHNMSSSNIYRVWFDMKRRCTKQNRKDYKYYGGRGIMYDPTWEDFVNFYKDMGDSYKEGLKLERINNEGDYEKQNCMWVTHKEQCNNRSSNHYVIYNSKTYTLSQLAVLVNINKATLWDRIVVQKLPIDKAVSMTKFAKKYK